MYVVPVEIFICALLSSVGVDCALSGSHLTDAGVRLPNGRPLHVNTRFTGSGSIRELNKLGSGDRPWTTATFFVLSGEGIVYGDPGLVDRNPVRSAGDALEITPAGLRALTGNCDNVFAVDIPFKPSTTTAASSTRASVAVAHQILMETQALALMDALP